MTLMLFGIDLNIYAFVGVIILVGLAVVGGLLFSQPLTFYVTPVFYTYMDALREI